MGDVVDMAARREKKEESPFGSCPTCGHGDTILNVGKVHWGVCETHGVRWLVGANLFSSWRYENEEIWEENWRRIGGYQDITPPLPPEPVAGGFKAQYPDSWLDGTQIELYLEGDVQARAMLVQVPFLTIRVPHNMADEATAELLAKAAEIVRARGVRGIPPASPADDDEGIPF